jgi:hypothetical protein
MPAASLLRAAGRFSKVTASSRLFTQAGGAVTAKLLVVSPAAFPTVALMLISVQNRAIASLCIIDCPINSLLISSAESDACFYNIRRNASVTKVAFWRLADAAIQPTSVAGFYRLSPDG